MIFNFNLQIKVYSYRILDMPLNWLKRNSTLSTESFSPQPFNILIVDDDDEVHQVTKLVLNDFVFERRPMNFISVYSKAAAEVFLRETELDIAIVLLDVVMETENAGLLLVKKLREFNRFTRIILRTGQPGVAPEHSVIREFDIDAYKSKTELKRRDLESLFYTSLRSYRDLILLKHQREGMTYILTAVNELNHVTSLAQLGEVIGVHLQNIFHSEADKENQQKIECHLVSQLPDQRSSLSLKYQEGNLHVYPVNGGVSQEINALVEECLKLKDSVFRAPYYVFYLKTQRDNEIMLILYPPYELNHEDLNILQLFSSSVVLIYENLILNKDIKDTQELIIRLLGGTMESRSKETGVHVIRVGEFSALLAKLMNCPPHYVHSIRIAAPLHDVGKVGTPDSILNKPGKLTAEEWEVMQKHAWEGYRILKDTGNAMVELAARIARDHHEKYNGHGYPRAIEGESISLEGRIVALADVFDALTHRRCYKDAWELNDVYQIIEEEKGKHFDPHLVDLLLSNRESFEKILATYPDE